MSEMNRTSYIPHPIDTRDVKLSEQILELAELLAKNTHEVWAYNRAAQGWTYGPCRDDVKKETPCMVAYEDLPEDEKEYDRKISLDTIKLIQKLGYQIVKKE